MKNLNVAYLLDFYGNILGEKQRNILEMYYQEDMSLAEIALSSNMTRQGVHDNIKRGEKELFSFEEKLGLMKRFVQISDTIDKITENISPDKKIDNETYQNICDMLSEIKSVI